MLHRLCGWAQSCRIRGKTMLAHRRTQWCHHQRKLSCSCQVLKTSISCFSSPYRSIAERCRLQSVRFLFCMVTPCFFVYASKKRVDYCRSLGSYCVSGIHVKIRYEPFPFHSLGYKSIDPPPSPDYKQRVFCFVC